LRYAKAVLSVDMYSVFESTQTDLGEKINNFKHGIFNINII